MTVLLGKAEVSLSTALERSAEILGASRKPLITGHGSDAAGVSAALRLAEQLGGVVDFCLDPDLLSQQRHVLDGTMIFTTALEAKARADVILVLGETAGSSAAVAHVLNERDWLGALEPSQRQIMWMCPGEADISIAGGNVEIHGEPGTDIGEILSALTSSLDRTPPAGSLADGDKTALPLTDEAVEAVVGRLVTARYGVIIWSPKDFNSTAHARLAAFFTALNVHGRVMALPVAGNSGLQTAAELCGWMTGYPSRFSFADGAPRHDPVLYEAERLAESGECDVILWLSSLETIGPLWKSDAPLIAVTRHGVVFRHAPAVWIETAIPGIDADGELYSEITQTILPVKAVRSSPHPSAAAVLSALCDRLTAGVL